MSVKLKTKFTNLKDLRGRQDEIGKTITRVFEEAGDEKDMDFSRVKCLGDGDTAAKLAELKKLNDESSDIHDDIKALEEAEEIIRQARKAADEASGFKAGSDLREQPGKKTAETKSIGEQFLEKKLNKKNATGEIDVDLKTIVQTGAGWAPESPRLPRVELYPLRALRVADAFPIYPTGNSDIKYMEETTHTNNAAEIAEETNAASPTAYGEGAIAMTERSVPIEKVPVWIPVTEEQMEDVAGFGEFINNRLTYMVRNRLDGQLIAGDGSTPNLRGVLNASGIQTQAKGADPTPDAFFKAMTLVRGYTAGTGFAEPSHCFIHPLDWQDIRLLRTADGIYIFGNPTEAGPERLWGVPVIVTAAETQNTGVVGDFTNYAALYVKRGLAIEISNSHGELFVSGVLAIKATMRCAAVYFRGTAFCKVTGI
jgi:HK97 family phage major capsid protein